MRSESPSSLDIPSSKPDVNRAHKSRQIVDRSTQEAPKEKSFKASFDESSAKVKGQAGSHKAPAAEKHTQTAEREHKQALMADEENTLLADAASSLASNHISQTINVSTRVQDTILASKKTVITPDADVTGGVFEGNAFGANALTLAPSNAESDSFGGSALLSRFEFDGSHEKTFAASAVQVSADDANNAWVMAGSLPVAEAKPSSISALAQSNDTLDARGASVKLSQAMAAIAAASRESTSAIDAAVKGPHSDIGLPESIDKSIAQLAMNSAEKLAASNGQSESVSTHQKINYQLNSMLARSVSESTIVDAPGQEALAEEDIDLDMKSVGTLTAERTEPKALTLGAEKVTLTAQVRVGMPGWADQIAERTASLVSQNIKQAEIQLNPQEMGPINVKISVNQDQVAVMFSAQNAGVREALDQSVQRLRDTLESEGMELIQADVDDQQAQPDQDTQEQDGHAPMVAEETLDGELDTQVIEITLPPSGIDQFA